MYDTELVELKEGTAWIDEMQAEQVEYLFFTIYPKTAQEKISLDVSFGGRPAPAIKMKVMTCLEKSPAKCKADIYSNLTLSRTLALPLVTPAPKVYNYPNY